MASALFLVIASGPAVLAQAVLTSSDALDDLAQARAATAKYHDVNQSLADGYVSAEEYAEVYRGGEA